METIPFLECGRRRLEKPLAAGIGKFDGVHVGHRKIIGAVLSAAAQHSLTPAVFTFRSYPCEFYLYPWEEKLSLLKSAGIEVCIRADFEEVKELEPEAFLERLKNSCGVAELVVGENFHFGVRRKGNAEFLLKWAEANGGAAKIVSPEKHGGETVSSSRVRNLLKRGLVHSARDLLGRFYSISGTVVKGTGTAKTLGTPTANVDAGIEIALAPGVYAAAAELGGKIRPGLAYYGDSPTFGIEKKRFELYVFDFTGNLIGRRLKVFLVKRIRPEKIFSSIPGLKTQISKDVETGRRIFANTALTSFSPG